MDPWYSAGPPARRKGPSTKPPDATALPPLPARAFDDAAHMSGRGRLARGSRQIACVTGICAVKGLQLACRHEPEHPPRSRRPLAPLQSDARPEHRSRQAARRRVARRAHVAARPGPGVDEAPPRDADRAVRRARRHGADPHRRRAAHARRALDGARRAGRGAPGLQRHDADALWLVVGTPPEQANTLEMSPELLAWMYPDGPKALRTRAPLEHGVARLRRRAGPRALRAARARGVRAALAAVRRDLPRRRARRGHARARALRPRAPAPADAPARRDPRPPARGRRARARRPRAHGGGPRCDRDRSRRPARGAPLP